jgi:hypothetical protein
MGSYAQLKVGDLEIAHFKSDVEPWIALVALVGVSEECRWPPAVVGKPVVTAARIDPSLLSSLEIDEVAA